MGFRDALSRLILPEAALQAAAFQAAENQQRKLVAAEPERRSEDYPVFLGVGGYSEGVGTERPTPKMNMRRLRTLSERPIPRAAINTIKKEISNLDYDIRVDKHVTKQVKHKRQIAIARNIFKYPNGQESFRTLIEKLVEDTLVGDYASFERATSPDPDHPLWMWTVDGATVQIYLHWDGDPTAPRYAQIPFGAQYGVDQVDFTDDQLVYVVDNARTSTPFGYSPLEAAATYIDWLLQVQTFAARSSASAIPKKLLNLGMKVDQNYLKSFRAWWHNEVEGRGKYPIIAGTEDPSVLDLGPTDDAGLFLEWQQMLISIIATSFDLNPQDLGMQFNMNRSSSVVQSAATRSGAIRPKAKLYEEVFTRNVLHYLGFYDLEFKFLDVEPQDVATTAKVHSVYVESDVVMLGEVREELGKPPFGDERDTMTRSEYLAKLGMQYPSSLSDSSPKPGAKSGGTSQHGRSSGRPSGSIER